MADSSFTMVNDEFSFVPATRAVSDVPTLPAAAKPEPDDETERELADLKAQTQRLRARVETPADAHQRAAAEWTERRTAAVAKYKDFAEVAESKDTAFTVPMLNSVINSEYGPDIAYWLGKHQSEAARIAALTNPINQALAIGRIEARISRTPVAVRPPARRPVWSVSVSRSAEADSESRVGKMVEALRRENRQLGWGQG